jgi:exodeoxyribonuclease V beta subunit
VDEVQSAEAVESEERAQTIFTFAKGKLAGDFFHEVFEKIEFDMSDADAVIASRMKKYGLDESEEAVAREAVRNVLGKELAMVAPGFSLSMLGKAERRHETNFYVPLTPFAKKNLRKFMDEYTHEAGLPAREEYQDGRVKGWLNGKIDLLFTHGGKYYLVDWKSNFLGGTREAYEPGKLREAMVRDDYFLQALLYIIGTDRYLRDRLQGYSYDRHFGGVFYIFLRGVDAAAGDDYGIYFEKPDAGALQRLSSLIAAPLPADTDNGNDHE